MRILDFLYYFEKKNTITCTVANHLFKNCGFTHDERLVLGCIENTDLYLKLVVSHKLKFIRSSKANTNEVKH